MGLLSLALVFALLALAGTLWAANPYHGSALRTDIANLVTGTATTWTSGSNHKLKLYTGTIPANAGAALSGNTAAATITAITWGAGSAGVATVTGSVADGAAVGGTVTFFRLYRTAAADPADCIFQGTVGTSAADLIINNTVISSGATCSLTGTNTYTSPQ